MTVKPSYLIKVCYALLSMIVTVENLRVSEVTTSTITITWDAPPDGYTVDAPYAEATDSSTEGRPVRRPANAATSTWHKFSSCDSFREYRLFVRLRDTGGNEGSYRNITARTLGEAPTGQPKDFNIIPNITFITVEWSAPDLWKRNGIITHYIIEWGETGNLTTLNYSVPNPTFNTTDDQRYTFRDLKPNTEYTFNIAAVNINGTGILVLNGMSTTLEEVPGPVRNLRKTASTGTSVTISWDPPEPSDGYTSVTYTIRYGVLDTPGEVINTQNTEETINSLDKGTPYLFEVFAGTTGGNGKEKRLICFTREKAPAVAVDTSSIKTKWISSTVLDISWEPLTLHEARGFPVYYIHLYDSSGPVKREIEPTANTTESSIVIDGLDSSQTYLIAIQVATDGGKVEGPISISVQTSQAVEDIKSVFIRSGSLIGGVIGGIIGGVVIGVVMTVIIYKIIFGVPNRDTFNKRKDLEKRTNKKGGHSADCEYEAPGIPMDTNPAYDMVNTYD